MEFIGFYFSTGWWRVATVYMSGVLAGSLWTSVLKPDKFLAGGSGGVYALITAHLGTVIMNYRYVEAQRTLLEMKSLPFLCVCSEMSLPWCRVLVVVIVAVSDVAVYIYDIYLSSKQSGGKSIG